MERELSAYKLAPSNVRLQSIFITLHTIKGSALIADHKEIARRAHQLEELIVHKKLICLLPKLDLFLSYLKTVSNTTMGIGVTLDGVISELKIFVMNKARELNKEIELCVSCESVEVSHHFAIDLKGIATQLLTNALVHGVKGSDLGKTKIEIKLSLSKKFLTFVVCDHGKGIKSIDECLEAGTSNKKATDYMAGRGIGLNVVQTIVARLGGRLLINSNQNIGSSFKIIIPKESL